MADLPPPTSRPTRRKRSSFPALSVMAEGEPLVWLAGGALTVCMAMIVLLLTVILVQGLATFWPARVVQLQTTDGQTLLGEVARTDRYQPEDSTDAQPMRRRLVRTGNFELTNTHYVWMPDSQLRAEDETLPPWAVTVERIEWGRFYGLPEEYRWTSRPPQTEEERELLALTGWLEAYRSQLAPDLQGPLSDWMSTLQGRLQATRQRAWDQHRNSLFATLQGTQAGLVQVTESGEIAAPDVPLDQLQLQVRWLGPEAAWQQFRARHAAVVERRRRLQYLERHAVGRCNRRLEAARLTLRSAELASQMAVLPIAQHQASLQQTWQDLDEREKTLQRQRQELATIIPAARGTTLEAEITRLATAELAAQRQQTQQQIDAVDPSLAQLPTTVREAVDNFVRVTLTAARDLAALQREMDQLREAENAEKLVLRTATGQSTPLRVGAIVRAYPANQLTTSQRLGVYLSRWWEFVSAEPREANSEGGVFPAIWGTVAMTLIMCMIVVPFGVLAALYLREYAKGGLAVSAVRIAINNLAGVPSIVFGVFGLGFFCYLLGAFTDGGPRNAGIEPLSVPRWTNYAVAWLGLVSLGLGLLVYQLRRSRYQVNRWAGLLRGVNLLVWLAVVFLTVVLVLWNPHFEGLFAAELPNPTYGKGGLLWASLTLALLTLPVVIVATEEALAAVPNSLREGSYASGASKWQTIRRIVLPHAMPGIMTGMILAMARGAGEVAPLMLVGAVKLAPELPLDGIFPFLHGDRSFMHLGFHIYDLGFQSQNSDAARPMVFTTTLLLIGIVASLNLLAIAIRARLRRRFQGGTF